MQRKKDIIKLLNSGKSVCEIARLLKCSKSVVSYHKSKINGKNPPSKTYVNFDWNTIQQYFDKYDCSYVELKTRFEISNAHIRSARKHGLFKSHTIEKSKLEYFLVKKFPKNFSTSRLKKRLIDENLLENKCSECGISGEWNGKELTLQLDHINGINNDNSLENLRILCPNCHSQTNTYAGKNKK